MTASSPAPACRSALSSRPPACPAATALCRADRRRQRCSARAMSPGWPPCQVGPHDRAAGRRHRVGGPGVGGGCGYAELGAAVAAERRHRRCRCPGASGVEARRWYREATDAILRGAAGTVLLRVSDGCVGGGCRPLGGAPRPLVAKRPPPAWPAPPRVRPPRPPSVSCDGAVIGAVRPSGASGQRPLGVGLRLPPPGVTCRITFWRMIASPCAPMSSLRAFSSARRWTASPARVSEAALQATLFGSGQAACRTRGSTGEVRSRRGGRSADHRRRALHGCHLLGCTFQARSRAGRLCEALPAPNRGQSCGFDWGLKLTPLPRGTTHLLFLVTHTVPHFPHHPTHLAAVLPAGSSRAQASRPLPPCRVLAAQASSSHAPSP